jgi:hypothetical protein
MKTTKRQIKFIALIFSVVMFFQSCKAYYKESVTLEQAVNEHKRAKVETLTKQTYKFQSISVENNQYYGVNKVKGETVKTPLNPDDLSKVRLQNKSLSTFSTIGVTLLSTLGLLMVGGAILIILGGGGIGI